MFKVKNAEIISVGTELLLGDIINTDAAYLARELAALGINVHRQCVVGDNRERLLATLADAFTRADTVFLTGGLGPTCDDITRECTAEFFSLPLIYHEEIFNGIVERLKNIGRSIVITENNKRQAYVPEGAEIMKNAAGTAPGLIVHGDGGRTAFLLPGPPHEFEKMTREQVIPYLAKMSGSVLVSRNVYMYGIGESRAEDILRPLMDAQNPTVAPYCGTGEVRIRVTASAATEEEAAKLCGHTVDEIMKTEAGRYVYAVLGEVDPDEGCAAALTLVSEFRRAGLTVAFAESCTGGLVSKYVTDVSGASAVILGSAVTYAESAKQKLIGVSEKTLADCGAVSEECAAEMAAGARETFGSDVAVSVTGLAGPGGDGVHECGHVCFGVASSNGVRTLTCEFGNRMRKTVRELAAMRALHEAINEGRAL